MTAKVFLSQAYRLDLKIRIEMEQLKDLSSLSKIAGATYSDMPSSPNRNIHKQEDLIVKILDFEKRINDRLNNLIELKAQIIETVESVGNEDYRLLLKLRYLSFRTWEEIAAAMNCSVRTVLRMHKKALAEVVVPETDGG